MLLTSVSKARALAPQNKIQNRAQGLQLCKAFCQIHFPALGATAPEKSRPRAPGKSRLKRLTRDATAVRAFEWAVKFVYCFQPATRTERKKNKNKIQIKENKIKRKRRAKWKNELACFFRPPGPPTSLSFHGVEFIYFTRRECFFFFLYIYKFIGKFDKEMQQFSFGFIELI